MKDFIVLLKTFLLIEFRSKEVSVIVFSSVLLFSILLAMGVGTAFLDPFTITKVFPFIFWTTIITSSSLAIGRAFESEIRSGVMEAFASSGVQLRAVFFAKQVVVAGLLFVSMLLGLLLLGVVFQIPLRDVALSLALVCFILSLAYAALGNILSIVALSSSLKAAFLPIILIPASFPLFFASLELTYGILEKDPYIFSSPWLGLSVFMAVLYSLLGAALFPAAVKGQF